MKILLGYKLKYGVTLCFQMAAPPAALFPEGSSLPINVKCHLNALPSLAGTGLVWGLQSKEQKFFLRKMSSA